MIRALAIGCFALSLGAVSARAGDPIRIGYVGTSLASLSIIVADAKGFFAAQGLDAKLMPFESSQPIALAIASGDADFGTTGLSEPFFVLGHQGTLKIIGGDTVEHKGFHGLGFVASNQAYAAGLTSVAKLGGHSVGVTQPGSPLEYSMALVLDKYHIDLKTVRVMGLQSNSNVASALTGNQVDAAIMSSANLYAIVNRGGARQIGWLDEEVHGADVSGTVTSTKFANERPETVKRFLVAFRQGAQAWDAAFLDAQGNRADQPNAGEMIALVAKGLGQPEDVVRRGLNYVDPEARIALADLQRMLDWYEARGLQKFHLDASTLIDQRYAKLTDRP
ncbi:MAG TPA: ABC transporter substrate-binding protein [Stellaceae bacterium]|jgi:NitT/TauT family transport system substrate-binding protein|nr:ABC transporter substrate-binding protein [Stellaceae bacterium]